MQAHRNCRRDPGQEASAQTSRAGPVKQSRKAHGAAAPCDRRIARDVEALVGKDEAERDWAHLLEESHPRAVVENSPLKRASGPSPFAVPSCIRPIRPQSTHYCCNHCLAEVRSPADGTKPKTGIQGPAPGHNASSPTPTGPAPRPQRLW